MRFIGRLAITATIILGAVAGVSLWLTRQGPDGFWLTRRGGAVEEGAGLAPAPAHASGPTRPTFADPNAPGTEARVFIDPGVLDAGIFLTADRYTGVVRDERSLAELADAIGGRVRRGLPRLKAESDRLALAARPTPADAARAVEVWKSIAYLCIYDGELADAARWLERAEALSWAAGASPEVRGELTALLGIVALRRGELENCIACVGPSSCIFPIDRAAVHTQTAGSREAVARFTSYLDGRPGDLRVRWLLNIAYMTLGEYPERVPPRYLIPLDRFRSTIDVGRFENVAITAGLGARGPDLAGGSIFDDFNGDGRPDLFTTSIDASHGASLFVNRGDGTFEDRSSSAGLDEQVYALNVARGDFDNDGRPDLVLLRGAWEKPARLTLLHNKGNGAFEDVTLASGLDEPIASESAVWGDYDGDGRLDLFVCGEYVASTGNSPENHLDVRDRCRLYHNQGDGTFLDVADGAGVRNDRMAKGAAWGDYDNDGRLDLYVSNMGAPGRLYHNQGDGTFLDVADRAGLTPLAKGFTCMFWDYDNDGRLDLFVSDYAPSLADVVADSLGLPAGDDASHPRLFHNLGPEGFRDVSREVGLGRPIAAMSVNCGDIDNDGYLDLYLGTGWMSPTGLVPNLMFKNVGGRRFEDVTESSGTGHLQKGHGISFADWDDDGDLDLFVVLGGGFPGDRGYNALFRNPGHGRHWLKVKLHGARTNRSALGAAIRVDLKAPDGTVRSIHRVVGNNGSFGGNPLVESFGLLDSATVATVEITWPTSRTTQTFHDLAADQSIEITEGVDAFKVMPRQSVDSKR